jgi:hypothetical protein
VAGEDAARGAAILEAAIEGGKKRSRERKVDMAKRNKEMAKEFRRRKQKGSGLSDTALMETIGKDKKFGLKKSASIEAIKQGLKILSG